jgi:hypothetical protein
LRDPVFPKNNTAGSLTPGRFCFPATDASALPYLSQDSASMLKYPPDTEIRFLRASHLFHSAPWARQKLGQPGRARYSMPRVVSAVDAAHATPFAPLLIRSEFRTRPATARQITDRMIQFMHSLGPDDLLYCAPGKGAGWTEPSSKRTSIRSPRLSKAIAGK